MSKFVFAGIASKNNHLCIAVTGGKRLEVCEKLSPSTDKLSSIQAWITEFENKNKVKILGAGITGTLWEKLFNKLWLETDVVTFKYENESDIENSAKKLAINAKHMFEPDDSFPAKVNKDQSVQTFSLVTLSDYEKVTPQKDFKKLIKLSKMLKKQKIIYISATPQGGGVALMRHSLVRLAKLLDLNLKWYVLKDDSTVFKITKRKIHNVLQDVAEDDAVLTEYDKRVLKKWNEYNFELLINPIKSADFIVIDDPQPSGLIPYIKTVNADAKIIYRSHIQLIAKLANKVGTNQHIVWDYLWQSIKLADAFVAHPIEEFIPKEVRNAKMKLYKMGASTDPLDGLNKELTDQRQEFYLSLVNDYLVRSKQKPIDPTRNYITQIARFDPSKGIPDVLVSYRKLVNLLKKDFKKPSIPQLVIAGPGSVDDPDGVPVYRATLELLKTKDYKDIADDIKVARLGASDQMLNVILKKSIIALQLSHKEGYEIKVSEAQMMGKPVVVYNNGGIPLQVKDNKSGFIVKDGNTDLVAKKLFKLLTDAKFYQKMSVYARKHVPVTATTVGKTCQWLELFLDV